MTVNDFVIKIKHMTSLEIYIPGVEVFSFNHNNEIK